MKFFLPLITLFICGVNVNGQTNVYHPFPYSNAQWRVNGSYWDCYPLCDLYQYTTGSDTSINTRIYTQIYKSGIYSLGYWDSIYIGALRNDTLNKKVYFADKDSTNERLLYDFSLTVGDTVFGILPGFSGGYLVINGMDSVLVGSNYRKEYLLDYLSIIEGIGSTQGLLESYFDGWESAYELICFSNNLDVYPSSSTSCPLITQLILNVPNLTDDQLLIDIFPNPFTSQTNIKFAAEQKNTTLKITDIVGKEIRTINFSGSQLIIDKGEMKEGIYFVQTTDGKKNVINKKIIIQ